MNLSHLAIFYAVACEGGFTKGARRLRLSQPAVSKEIQALENRIGVALIDRSNRHFRLTSAGELLSSYARRIFALEEEAEHALAEMQGLRRGRLAIGASTTIGNYLLPRLLGIYRGLYPHIELNLEIANTSLVQQRLFEHALQIGLVEGLASNTELQATQFARDELVVIAAPDHPLLDEHVVMAEELCKYPMVLREEGSGTRVLIDRALAAKNMVLKPVMTLGNSEAIKQAVAAGIGLGIVSDLTVSVEVNCGRVAILPIADLTIERPLHLLHTPDRNREPTVAAFLKLLKEHFGRRPKKTGRCVQNKL
ncbi:MAG: LysR family transcriptional regulator [bacterium]|nr:LysR family transcriptional regulator [bacterium]